MTFHICHATNNDFESVYSFINELEEQVFDRENQERIFHDVIKNPNNIYLIAFNDETPIGFVSCHAQLLLHHSGLIGEIQEMFVAEKYRSAGVGKLLLENLIIEAKRKNFLQLEVTSSKRREKAHQFYIREGFAASHFKFTLPLI